MKSRKLTSSQKFALRYLLIYTALFAVISTAVFFLFIKDSRSLVWSQDAMGQYLPQVSYFMRETRTFIKELLRGHFSFKLYDLAIGFGDVVPMHLDPTYFMYLLFKPEHVEASYNFVTLLRFYLAGLTMSAYLFYFKRSTAATLAASFIYIYSEFGLANGLKNPKFIMPMVFLPLCFLCVEEIMKGRRWYLFTVLMAFQMWNGYYYIYMNTLAIGCYFLTRYFFGKHSKSVADYFIKLGILIGSWFIGVLIGNMNLINSFSSYLTSVRTTSKSGVVQVNYLSYGAGWALKVFRNFLGIGVIPTGWTNLGFIPLVYIAIVILFLRKGHKELKFLVILENAFLMFPFVGYIFSGFGAITNRWLYMYAFTMAAVVAFVWEDFTQLSKKDRLIIFAAMLPYIAVALRDQKYTYVFRKNSMHAAILLVATFLFLLFLNLAKPLLLSIEEKLCSKTYRRSLISVLLIFLCGGSLAHSAYVVYSPSMNDQMSLFEKSGRALGDMREFALSVIPKLEDEEPFYRSAAKKTSMKVQSASMVLDYYGTVYYFSTINKYIQDFFEKLGMTSWNLIQMKGFDGKAIPDTLASVKYFSIKHDNTQEVPYGYNEDYQVMSRYGTEYWVYENEMALPIGYTYDTTITEEELLSYDVAQRGEVLMQTAVVDEVSTLQSPSDLTITGQRIPIEKMHPVNLELNEGSFTALTGDSTATLSLTFDAPEGCEVYLGFKNLQNPEPGHKYLDFNCGDYSNAYKLRFIGDTYLTGQEDFVINLGYHEEGANECLITFETQGTYTYDDLYIFCQPMKHLNAFADQRRADVLENVQIKANAVSGTISLDTPKLLVATIPYQTGWKAYVDGKETTITRSNLMYSGLYLDAGEHTIEFHYCMPGFYISLIVSAVAFLIFLILYLIDRKKRAAAKQ